MSELLNSQGRAGNADRAVESKPENPDDPSAQRTVEGMPSGQRLLVVDDEESALALCAEVGREVGLETYTADSAERALELMAEHPADIVITDLKLPGNGGLSLLSELREHFPRTSVIVLTQFGTIETAIEATRLGAEDYLTKPFHVEELRKKLKRILWEQDLDEENRVLREQLRARSGFGSLIGVSGKMQRVYKLIEKVSQHNYPVLVLGESGTGKELVARAIHYMGNRRQKPFVPVDCSALVPTLIEAELFGYAKGAFTGATQSKQGLMETANSGTLFLDEIGDLPVDLQVKLLRALQEKEIKPVGSTQRIPTASRIIAATNRNLEAAVRAGEFRQDLFFRLNVVQIKLPPLRDRKSDIPALVAAFLERFSGAERPARTVSEDAMTRLLAYDWPGNVRELENAIERAVALGSGPILHVGDLPSSLQYGAPQRISQSDEVLPLEEIERRAIFRALRETAGDKMAAARILGIGKTMLYRKLKQYESQRLPAESAGEMDNPSGPLAPQT